MATNPSSSGNGGPEKGEVLDRHAEAGGGRSGVSERRVGVAAA